MSEAETLLANIAHAIHTRETVTIGGGIFTPDELRDALCGIRAAMEPSPAAPAMLAALKTARDLIDEAITVHIYGDDEKPDEGCDYVTGLAEIEAAIAAAEGREG